MARWMNLLAVLVVITAISRPDAEATSSMVLTPTVALTTEIPVDINDSDDAVDDSDDSDDSNDSDDSDDTPTGLKIGADVKTVDKIVSTYKNWFALLAKGVQLAVRCTRSMLSVIKAIIKLIRSIKVNDPQTPIDKILPVLYQTSYITIDLPAAITVCLGKAYPAILDPISTDLGIVQFLLAEIIYHEDSIMDSWDRFKALLVGANFTEAVNALNETDISSLKSGMASNSTCGYELQRLTDRTWRAVDILRDQNPDISKAELRVTMSKSELMIHDIPTVTNNCMEQMIAESDEATAYETRDTLRKTFGVIMDNLIDSGKSDNGSSIAAKEYIRIVTDKVMTSIALLDKDVTRITSLLAEYIQPICGPTQFIGEIDDGTSTDTLGLKVVGKAFNASSLSWARVGDGVVTIKFVSVDKEDVTVNIMSGGDKYAEVDVSAGKVVTWKSNVTDLGGRTLYLDRWRPGFLGLPGTGGGSLKLWVMILASIFVYAYGQLFYYSDAYTNTVSSTIGTWFGVPVGGGKNAGGHSEMVRPMFFFLFCFIPMALSIFLLEFLRHFNVRRISSRFVLNLARFLRLKPRVFDRVIDINLGEFLFLGFLIGGNIYVFQYFYRARVVRIKQHSSDLDFSTYLEMVALTFGYVCIYNLGFLFLPATRNCVWMEFLNISYANGVKYHRWIGVITITAALLHCTGYYWRERKSETADELLR
ncbi:hypothetical protein BBO99_00009381 [Phytophthora kernoviae]|uniref:Ferric oxidoreductase domain-containing protein n=2 Tax=Phytophthora kernoviae TaxID=325452 RepID=A0A421GCU1_9STRA|nr:hypothetical protein JM18_009298 [Phytophthora kernoviae]RLN73511.1 hypothetical protein BBO99_00009381 [Phytophthora kernoviae]